ncbi:helix-turn-helix domain-containing protein [Streptomyces sp. NPDC056061]|uniref:helix-turn-helix domain-containing protein n=1 Tax=Streptomyces sp. NPDC056061 TaxID=3345700 RepID=UPI0035DDA16B
MRLAAGITQQTVGERTGMDRATYHRVEGVRSGPHLRRARCAAVRVCQFNG